MSKDSTYRHVSSSPDKCIGDRQAICKFARHAKVAEFELTLAIDQNVAGLDVSMHDAVCFVEISKAADYHVCHSGTNRVRNWPPSLVNLVQRAVMIGRISIYPSYR